MPSLRPVDAEAWNEAEVRPTVINQYEMQDLRKGYEWPRPADVGADEESGVDWEAERRAQEK